MSEDVCPNCRRAARITTVGIGDYDARILCLNTERRDGEPVCGAIIYRGNPRRKETMGNDVSGRQIYEKRKS